MSVAERLKLSYAEYVARENASEMRHELIDGEVFAMAGGTPEHSPEVLSNSTEACDRHGKFKHYKRLESLQEYVLVSQHRPLIERFAKRAGIGSSPDGAGVAERIALSSVPATLDVDEIFPAAGTYDVRLYANDKRFGTYAYAGSVEVNARP